MLARLGMAIYWLACGILGIIGLGSMIATINRAWTSWADVVIVAILAAAVWVVGVFFRFVLCGPVQSTRKRL